MKIPENLKDAVMNSKTADELLEKANKLGVNISKEDAVKFVETKVLDKLDDVDVKDLAGTVLKGKLDKEGDGIDAGDIADIGKSLLGGLMGKK